MATSADELTNCLNTRIDAFEENHPVKASEIIPLRSTVTALTLAVESTFTTGAAAAAEESLRRLWALSNDVVSESSQGAGIHIIGVNSGGGAAGGGSDFKLFFRQKFDPKENTTAAFITVYEAAMRQSTDEQKRDYILNCLGAAAQEVIVPELPTIQSWAQMRALLIAEFGWELSLEVKKDAFLYIAFKSKETLVEFVDLFYVKGQQLMTSQKITINEAFSSCLAAHKVNPMLCFQFKSQKANLRTMKDIKNLLMEM